MRRLLGDKLSDRYAFGGATVAATASVAHITVGAPLWYSAGVAMGLWLAGLYAWVTDPETELPVLPF